MNRYILLMAVLFAASPTLAQADRLKPESRHGAAHSEGYQALQTGRSAATAPVLGLSAPPPASGSYGASLEGRNPASSGLP